MKTLDQVEARGPISSAPFTISTSGSYYLTANLTVASGTAITITISADHVTLDLNGFTISSTASLASGTAVLLSGTRKNITVKNGHIRGTTTFAAGAFTTGGIFDGVANLATASANLRMSDLKIFGMGDDGIDLGANTVPTFVVERCNVSVCARRGIQGGLIRDCAADTTGDTAIAGHIVTSCSGETVNTAVFAGGISGVTIENCRGISDSGPGVSGSNVNNSRGSSTGGSRISGTNVINCFGLSTAANQIFATNVTNSSGTSSPGVGLSAANATNCFGFSTSGAAGIDANPGTASLCRGQRAGGTAISAGIAIGCTAVTGTVNSLNKFLGTP